MSHVPRLPTILVLLVLAVSCKRPTPMGTSAPVSSVETASSTGVVAAASVLGYWW